MKLKRTPGIWLVGFMGAGKTTVGTMLAGELGWTFADLDTAIEQRAGCTISAIFENQGEEEFRRLETDILRESVRAVQAGRATVAALGGGAFAREENIRMVNENGVSIWLDCPLHRVRLRVEAATHRPLARDPAAFERLYLDRLPFYARADYRIEIRSDDPGTAVREILDLPLFGATK